MIHPALFFSQDEKIYRMEHQHEGFFMSESCEVTPIVEPVQPTQKEEPSFIDIADFAKIEFRVALIEAAEQLPKSKKLLKLQVDLGPLGKRQILSGIAQHYTPESLVGKKIVIVANLKPAKMMGEESQGMLLAASDEGDTVISILQPLIDVPPGSRVK